MAREDYDFGKHYFVLEKKLENHINADGNPHNITKADVLLTQVENYPFRSNWDFDQEGYISALLVKEKFQEQEARINDLERTINILREEINSLKNNNK